MFIALVNNGEQVTLHISRDLVDMPSDHRWLELLHSQQNCLIEMALAAGIHVCQCDAGTTIEPQLTE